MRALICDQESEMLEAIARAFDVDTATSKATCIDLMRANPFDVLVASERLSDGSGLELLSHAASRWPDTLRILALEPQRLQLLRGKLAPFGLHATIRYPIDEDELEAVLNRMSELLEGGKSKRAESPRAPAKPPAAPSSTRAPVAPASRALRPSVSPAPRALRPPVTPASQAPRPRATPAPVTLAPRAPRAPSARSAPFAPSASASAPTSASASAPTPAPTPAPTSASSARSARFNMPPPTPQSRKAPLPQSPATPSSTATRAPASAPAKLAARPPSSPPPVRRKLGNYTPLGAPEDAQLRIVEREFDQTIAPLAARAIRTREEAARTRTPKEKLAMLVNQLSDALRRLLKR